MTTTARILLAAALAAGSLAPASALLEGSAAWAQSRAAAAPAKAPAPPKEVALTQAQIDGIVAAQGELAKVSSAGDGEKPDPKAKAAVEAIVKKNGFAGLDDFQGAADSVEAVLDGVDPETKAYVGVAPLLRKQIAAVEADKAMPAKDKAAALKELRQALAQGEPSQPSEGNIALVTRNYDTLAAVMGEGQGQE
ncbi:hypothetical protein MMB17_02330 [Methylobacterium organophilum]|uniref:hypothetical protein n=1 Tax=Methylobacterium organophilum TaxID=410 RepID=UPI001F138C17|nr:hypothetical protein [Methylobacterium organophilum]UMY18207.1 hypothetical protein MMB17_02330 [Methylobacterium organophilum]